MVASLGGRAGVQLSETPLYVPEPGLDERSAAEASLVGATQEREVRLLVQELALRPVERLVLRSREHLERLVRNR